MFTNLCFNIYHFANSQAMCPIQCNSLFILLCVNSKTIKHACNQFYHFNHQFNNCLFLVFCEKSAVISGKSTAETS